MSTENGENADIDVAQMVTCEGCPSLLDDESCKHDMEGCPLCDDCWDDMIVRNTTLAEPIEQVSPVSLTDEVFDAARAVVEAWPESEDFPAMRRLRNAFVARDLLFARMVEHLSLNDRVPR